MTANAPDHIWILTDVPEFVSDPSFYSREAIGPMYVRSDITRELSWDYEQKLQRIRELEAENERLRSDLDVANELLDHYREKVQ